tara:strand:- start:49 stop:573 length:525 start_codon:yes stop_codon:yes gene_type:complete
MIKLKKLLSETKAWDREKFGDPLPTLKDVMDKHQETITEGTRWLVGIEAPNGKVRSTYGHWDGYPQHAGKMLKKYYKKPVVVQNLMQLGQFGISSIGPKIKGSKDHSFDNPEKDVTVFYGRDRGEKSRAISNWKDRDSVKLNSGEEFAYIFSMKDKKWYYKSKRSNPQDWTELK